MLNLFHVVLAALLATASTASIVPTSDSIGTASVLQVRNTKHVKKGPRALAKAYLKYGVPITPDLKAAIRNTTAGVKRATGSVVATPMDEYDSVYLSPVSIGSPEQVLNLEFDTGSSDLWVFGSETPIEQVNGQAQYDPYTSSTASRLFNATWSITYEDKSTAGGDVWLDNVTIGGLTVYSQAVEAAKIVSPELTESSDVDGLLGLAFSGLNTVSPTPQSTFFDNAKNSLDSPLFTADLKRNKPGTYNFGYIDNCSYTGSIAYSPIFIYSGYWQWISPGYAIGSSAFNATPIDNIADTGSSLLLLPNSIVDAYYAQVQGAHYDTSQVGYVFPCNTTLPSFTFGVGDGAQIVIPGSYINYASVDSCNCFGGIQSNADLRFAIFGDVALKAAFVVFDAGNTTRIGWASKNL